MPSTTTTTTTTTTNTTTTTTTTTTTYNHTPCWQSEINSRITWATRNIQLVLARSSLPLSYLHRINCRMITYSNCLQNALFFDKTPTSECLHTSAVSVSSMHKKWNGLVTLSSVAVRGQVTTDDGYSILAKEFCVRQRPRNCHGTESVQQTEKHRIEKGTTSCPCRFWGNREQSPPVKAPSWRNREQQRSRLQWKSVTSS